MYDDVCDSPGFVSHPAQCRIARTAAMLCSHAFIVVEAPALARLALAADVVAT